MNLRLAAPESVVERERKSGPAPAARCRLEQVAAESFQFIWRTLRRLGVAPDAAVDDAAQRVFETAARKRDQILPGHERAFVFKTAVLVAAEVRRANRRSREHALPMALELAADSGPLPDQLLDARRRRDLLDGLLEALEPDTRAVFVLFELEGLSSPEIAELLELPVGTVASRLRRAREDFHAAARRLRARLSHGGDP